ncbi:hypothetical protein [Streptomyces antimycoticus]|uniref:hypothetical protein n=1 Tax=Streptomyces antimycoticus TaxID=68175 RepID=UPI001F2B5A5B|nr:hypothetical protein [Streptomyces antimycoticus]
MALGGTLLAAAADYGEGLRTSMAIGTLAYLAAAGLAWLCAPPKPKGETPDREARTSR